MDVRVGDRLELKKEHPCGGKLWYVMRVGADFRIKCLTCGREVLTPRSNVEKRIKKILRDSPETQG